MMGLGLLLIALIWLAIVYWLMSRVVRKLPDKRWRIPIGVVLVALLFPLPLIDEIVGGIQFRQLCRENATIHVDPGKAHGTTVYLADLPRMEIKGTWVPIVLTPWRFVDVKTGETIVSYNTLDAGPGFFHVSGAPLTFRGYCAPGGHVNPSKLLKEIGAIRIERSAIGREGR